MIAGLDSRVDIIFEEDTEHFLVTLPYCRESKEFFNCCGMVGVRREWMPGFKAWRFGAEYYSDILKLLFDYLAKEEQPNANTG